MSEYLQNVATLLVSGKESNNQKYLPLHRPSLSCSVIHRIYKVYKLYSVS